MPHVLLIEDDTRVSSLIQRGLQEQDFDVTVAYDGEMGRRLAAGQSFDVIITDIILPKLNGLELCKLLREQGVQTPILMLTALGTTDDKIEGFDTGADDYMVKPFEMRELMARLRVLLKRNRQGAMATPFLRYADLEINLHTKAVSRQQTALQLTPKEFKLLEYMVRNPERVLSRTEIAEKVWDTHFDTGTNFIDVYINYLRKKVEKGFDGKLIHTKPGMGFMLSTEQP